MDDFVLFVQEVKLVPSLPAPGSDEEPTWLQNCRQAIGNGVPYVPNVDDLEALSKISHFEFELDFPFRFEMKCSCPVKAMTIGVRLRMRMT